MRFLNLMFIRFFGKIFKRVRSSIEKNRTIKMIERKVFLTILAIAFCDLVKSDDANVPTPVQPKEPQDSENLIVKAQGSQQPNMNNFGMQQPSSPFNSMFGTSPFNNFPSSPTMPNQGGPNQPGGFFQPNQGFGQSWFPGQGQQGQSQNGAPGQPGNFFQPQGGSNQQQGGYGQQGQSHNGAPGQPGNFFQPQGGFGQQPGILGQALRNMINRGAGIVRQIMSNIGKYNEIIQHKLMLANTNKCH